MKSIEVNFDGLVGPTHHYAGLSDGNLASKSHAENISNPKEAALQGLEKMRLLTKLGITQGIFPPHERPAVSILKNLGFSGNDQKILQNAYQTDPNLLRAIYSASGMWTANAATVTPSADSQDGKVHLTPANLNTFFHRSIETKMTHRFLKKIFRSDYHFTIHDPLFSHPSFADEGSANHNRFCLNYKDKGAHIFVYDRDDNNSVSFFSQKAPARQTLAASKAIARLHGLDPEKILFVKQNPLVVDEGVFHNDLISVGNQNVFLYHESAFENSTFVVNFLKEQLGDQLYLIPVSTKNLTVEEAVKSYLFNSQIVTLKEGSMAIIAPLECQEGRAKQVLLDIVACSNPIEKIHFISCHESMDNGGGPACLRLRVVLTEAELQACHPGVILTENLYESLVSWVKKNYRDKLSTKDLLDPHLLDESDRALDELTGILSIGSLYNFQKI